MIPLENFFQNGRKKKEKENKTVKFPLKTNAKFSKNKINFPGLVRGDLKFQRGKMRERDRISSQNS